MILNAIIKAINLLISALGALGTSLINLLPESPFNVLNDIEIPYLEALNWLIPVNFMITVLTYWVFAIGLYYVVSVALRWVKIIE